MIKLGLTGSIGMGKSTVAALFKDLGAAIWDADKTVHELYSENGAAVVPIGSIFPQVVIDGAIARDRLSDLILKDHSALARIERIVHPMVRAQQRDLMLRWESEKIALAVFDIPLLFEHNRHTEFDATAVVMASEDIRRARVLARPGMSVEKYEKIIALQMPDHKKIRRASYIISTDCSLEETANSVKTIYTELVLNAEASGNETGVQL